MKKTSVFRLAFLSVVLCAIFFSSCEKKPEQQVRDAKKSNDRSITIINNTGRPITAYRVTAAGALIEDDKTDRESAEKGMIVVKIDKKAFDDCLVLNIQVIDVNKRIFAHDFEVPLEGNTNVVIEKEYRVTEGWLKDKVRDFVDLVNNNK